VINSLHNVSMLAIQHDLDFCLNHFNTLGTRIFFVDYLDSAFLASLFVSTEFHRGVIAPVGENSNQPLYRISSQLKRGIEFS